MTKMEQTGVRKCHSVTARTARVIRRDVIGRYHWLRFEPRLKVILLSCTLGVVSLIAGCAGTSGPSQDNAADSTQRTGLAANQTVDMGCGARDSVVAKLGEKYGEIRRGGGLAGPTAIFEIWASEATGTWTILKTSPDGMTCIMAVGDGWQDDAGELTPAGTPV